MPYNNERLVFSMGDRSVCQVQYFDGVQYVLRVAVKCAGSPLYLVYDRYDDGTEYLVTKGYKDQVQRCFYWVDAVNLLEEVMQ